MKKSLYKLLTYICVVYIMILMYIFPVHSHEWYDPECCNDKDCSVVLDTQDDGHGNLIVTSKHGTVLIEPDFIRRPSKDDKDHVCMIVSDNKFIVLCYYIATGS